MDSYGYISAIALFIYVAMMLIFLAAKRNQIVNSFLLALLSMTCWTGGSCFMRALLWPNYIFWYHVSLLGILLLPYAYYCFILNFGGITKRLPGQIYLVTMLICFGINVCTGKLLKYPEIVEKNGVPTFIYDVKPPVIIFFGIAAIFLVYLFWILLKICKGNPHMQHQYEPIVIGILLLFI